jgi:trimeric autotransporter adhesin
LNVSDGCFIGNIFGATSSGGIGVFINSAGQLGASTSSRRFKDEIKPMPEASDALFALRPVTFRYKKEIDPKRVAQFGLVAEDVEAVNSDLVVRDKDGKPYSVRYEQVNAMLLNEFLKEHKKVEKLEATVADLATTVKEQAAHLQRVSAQLDNSVSRVAVTNR